MIGQNTVKGRKTRNKVAELNEEIRRLKEKIAILQEDKEKFRKHRDSLASKVQMLGDPYSFISAALDKEKAKFERDRRDLFDGLQQTRHTLEGLKIANSRLKSALWMAGLIGVLAGLMLAPILVQL